MNKEKKLPEKDLYVFVGVHKETKVFKIIPFLFYNTKPYKMIDLLDGEVYVAPEKDYGWSSYKIFEQKYNITEKDVFRAESRSLYNEKTKITLEYLDNLIKDLTDFYEKEAHKLESDDIVLYGKDVHWFVGHTKDYKNIVVLPYIVNEDNTQIKVLTDNKLYKVEVFHAWLFITKQYNLDYIDTYEFDDVCKNDGLPRNIKSEQIITNKDFNRTIKYLTKLYEKDLPNIKRKDIKESFIREIKDKILNFEEVIINDKKVIAYSEDIKYVVGTDKNNNLQVIPFIKGSDGHQYKILTSDETFKVNDNSWGPKELAEHYNLNLERTYCLGEVFPKAYYLTGVDSYNKDKLVSRENLNEFITIITNHYIKSKKEESEENAY